MYSINVVLTKIYSAFQNESILDPRYGGTMAPVFVLRNNITGICENFDSYEDAAEKMAEYMNPE